MKTTNHIAKWIQAYFMLLFCISTVIFTACNEDKLNLDQEIYGLGGNDEQKNELDKWLYENYTQAYNIEVKYKWNSYELNTTAQLVRRISTKTIVSDSSRLSPVHGTWLRNHS